MAIRVLVIYTLLPVILFFLAATQDVVEPNHFSSNTKTNKLYTLGSLNKDKPLAIILKNPDNSVGLKYDNKITIKLTIGDQTHSCTYQSLTDLCTLQSIGEQKGTMEISCERTPCEATWKMVQPEIKELQNSENIEKFYRMPDDSRRMHINIICEDLQVKDVSNMFRAYSNNRFMRFNRQRQTYIFFPNPKSGFVYFEMKPKFFDCAMINIDRIPDTISKDVRSDILINNATNKYSLTDLPDHAFQMNLGLHVIAPSEDQKNKITLKIISEKDGSTQTLRSNEISLPSESKTFDISYAIPKISSDLKDITVELSTNILGVLLDYSYEIDEKQVVEATEISYFDLKKGEKLEYKLMDEQKAAVDDKIRIVLFNKNKVNSTKSECNLREGCQFVIEAIQDATGFIFLGVGDENTPVSDTPIILDLGQNDSFTKKVRDGEKVYVKKAIKQKKAFQVLINTGNAMVYMATTKKCNLPSKTCYNSIATIRRPFVFIPHSDDEKQAIFLIEAFENCEFTLTLISQEGAFIRLKDSQPFSYQMDDKEEELKFIFTRQSETDLSFNLIGPLHALDLIVQNSKQISDDYESSQISSEGFLQFKNSDISGNDFSIVVKKKDLYKEHYVHFLLIASSKGKEIRLQSGTTYYETLPVEADLKKGNNAEYIFQFNAKKDYVLNFYSHNLKEEAIRISLVLSASNDWKDEKNIMKMQIDKTEDTLDLNEIADQLCVKSGEGTENCQLFMKLQNFISMEIDIAITLMGRDEIIQLQSGVWQSFDLHSVAKSAHFFYDPKLKKKSIDNVNIYFKTSDPNVRLAYTLYAGSYDTLNPTQWPFPTSKKANSEEQKKFRPIKHIGISSDEIKQCYPYCVVLMSVIELSQSQRKGSFSIMASDSIIEIRQKQKLDAVFSAEQEKIYLIDLKYAIDQDKDVIFNKVASMGIVNLYANVYSERNDRVPDEDDHDFKLQKSTLIPISKIKDIIDNEEMDEHNNIYLYIIAIAMNDAKIAFDFSFDASEDLNIKLLDYDSLEHLSLPPKTSKIYYVITDQPFQLKIVRQTGFPFLATVNCKQDLDKCSQQITEEDNIGKQLLSKVSANTDIPCETCYFFFKITTKEDPASLQMHIQSEQSQIELMESKSVYDFTEKEESNKYVFYAIKGQQVFVNVDVSEGAVEVQITDMHEINMKKGGKQLITFSIPTTAESSQKMHRDDLKEKMKQASQKDDNIAKEARKYIKQNGFASQTYLSAFGLSQKFVVLHIEVKSADPSKQSIYTIGYSSGEREFDLQDGLITDFQLSPSKQSTYYYTTKQKGHAYLVISMDSTKKLKDLSISLKYCEPQNDIIDEDCWKQFKTDKPAIKEKTPNPTIMYSLPAYNFFAISLNYGGSGSAKVTLGINHQQVMILPMEKQFPFILHAKQDISMLTEISSQGYVYVTVRKCDDSSPTFSYTFSYDSFQEGDYNYESTLSDNPKSEFFSKVQPGTMYLKFISPEETSLLSIYVKFQTKKTKQTTISAGGKWNLDYSVIDSSTAQLTFKPPVCTYSECSKMKYYLMTTTKQRDLYSQLVCPSNYFSTYQAVSIDPINSIEISPKQNSDGSLSTTFKLADQISYVGIKAVDTKSRQVFYKPIQVATIWGSISRSTSSHKWMIFSLVVLSCLILLFLRRLHKKTKSRYQPINQDN